MGARLAVSWLEVILIVLFGVGATALTSFRAVQIDSHLAADEPREDLVQLQHEVPEKRAELAAIEQEFTARRLQLTTSRLDVERHRADADALKSRYPALRSTAASSPAPDPGPSGIEKAYEDAIVAQASSTALVNSLVQAISDLERWKHKVSDALIDAQRQAAVDLGTAREAHAAKRTETLVVDTVPWLIGLVLAAGVAAFVLAPHGRKRAAGGMALLSTLVIACAALGYHLDGAAGAAAGAAVPGLLVVLIAARVVR